MKPDKMNFEWDPLKNKLNIRKHGLSFEVAARVFGDANRVELYDYKHSAREDRYLTIGLVNDIIAVVYTERVESIRLISARVATAAERKYYYEQNS